MPYTPQTWNDNDTTTPLSAARLTHIEAGITAAQSAAETISAFGPNWIAASNAPAAIRQAVAAANGVVAAGSNDHSTINTALGTYKTVYLTEGTFVFGGSVPVASAHSVFGSGSGTKVTGASGLASSFFTIAADEARVSSLWLDGTGTTSSCHGVDVNVTTSSGFAFGIDACPQLDNLILSNIQGDGVRMQGTVNRSGKLTRVHVYGAAGRGFYLNSPGGSIDQCAAVSCGSHGFMVDTLGTNWRITNARAYSNTLDGFYVLGQRHTLTGVEAQDNKLAGFRLVCTQSNLLGFVADSNSWATSNANTNLYSGVEVGRNSDGTFTGGMDISISGGQAWDRNDSSRGRAQRSGIRVRTGALGLSIVGVTTGDSTGTLYNVTKGIEFDTAADQTNAANAIYAINHRVAIKSI